LHSAVGKQNGDAHSGVNGPVRFYEKRNLEKTTAVLQCLVQNLKHQPNIVGIQLINEPQNNSSLPGWYTRTLNKLREKCSDIPLYIHDAWNTDQYTEFVKGRNDFVAVDHHLYRCFTSEDQKHSGDEHANILLQSTLPYFRSLSDKARGNLVVAEYSAALNPASLGSDQASEQDRQRRVFAKAQLELYEQCCAGTWFWCYKKQEGWDAGWSLRDATHAEIMPAFHGIRKSKESYHSDPALRDAKRKSACG
jgi:glucan 1,3-beta-glucosidase